jgi:hypothetical protein
LGERCAQKPIFIESRNDDGYFHRTSVAANVSSLKLQSRGAVFRFERSAGVLIVSLPGAPASRRPVGG